MNRKQLKSLQLKYGVEASLLTNFIDSFGLVETEKIMSMKPSDLKRTVRVNLMKVTREQAIQRLKQEKIIAKEIPEPPEGLEILKGWEKVGSSQTYLAGEIMPQGLGSMLAVHALDPRPGDRVLDMAAAPGGKTCFIGERIRNSGLIVANDKSTSRLSSLISNLSRHSIDPVIIMNLDAGQLRNMEFDRILLDAPCTGEGLVVSQPSRRKSKGIQNSYTMQNVQINLLRRALSLLKVGGIMVYSTCSLSFIENEQVLLSSLVSVEILDTGIISGNPGNSDIHQSFELSKRLLPSKLACDGFFITKIRRLQ